MLQIALLIRFHFIKHFFWALSDVVVTKASLTYLPRQQSALLQTCCLEQHNETELVYM